MDSVQDDTKKLDIKNIALKAPKKSITTNYWNIFWLSNIPKKEGISNIRKEYLEVMENMAPS
jgi:hypothetical protein